MRSLADVAHVLRPRLELVNEAFADDQYPAFKEKVYRVPR
jgi:hypothetical protein